MMLTRSGPGSGGLSFSPAVITNGRRTVTRLRVRFTLDGHPDGHFAGSIARKHNDAFAFNHLVGRPFVFRGGLIRFGGQVGCRVIRTTLPRSLVRVTVSPGTNERV
jgi:hypothetical protein